MFQTLIQGDLTVTDYCNKMKSMADALGTLGELVLDRTLVLNVHRGLNERFSHMAALIKRISSFPSYSDVRANLLIMEVTLASKSSTSTSFMASSSPRPIASCPTDPPSTGQGVRGQGAQGGKGSQGGSHGGSAHRGPPTANTGVGVPAVSQLAPRSTLCVFLGYPSRIDIVTALI